MVEKPTLYFLTKLVTVIASISILSTASVDMTFSVISTLGFACVFLFELLLYRLYKNRNIILVIASASMIACFMLGLDTFFPLYMILVIQLLDITIENKMFYEILSVSVLLSMYIFAPSKNSFSISIILIAFVLFIRIAIDKLTIYKKISEEQKEVVVELNKKLSDIKSLMKTLKYSTSLEERNRIAARIHDQVGHGISGSIIMLEAAMLIMKDNPEKATGSIQTAINNLREGVDEIRMALREERADRYLIGINDVTTLLEEFKVGYNISTKLNTKGELNKIRIDIWSCVQENLNECLTNVLKHSNATEVQVNIEVFQKIVKVEYKDNGRSKENFEKGLGLEAIEERTIQTKGRCFFSKGENGFCVTNIFSL